MARELSGYRFVGGKIAPITSDEEIAEVQQAVDSGDPYKPVVTHLDTALSKLADRKEPDYRNSVKESVSAVEAMCRIVAGDERATLGDALKMIEGKVPLHGALREGFGKLYGYSGDADGIRHSLMAESNLDFEDAKYMLVSCSAFINYLKVKASKAGMEL